MQELQLTPRVWRELPCSRKTEKGAPRCDNLPQLRLADPHPVEAEEGEEGN